MTLDWTNLAWLLVGVILALYPAMVMQSYSRWNLVLARKMLTETLESLKAQTSAEATVVGEGSEIRDALRSQAVQLRAMDESIGVIFGRMQQAIEMPLAGNRTVRQRDSQRGEEMPPFPGAGSGVSIVSNPLVDPAGFVEKKDLPEALKKRVDPALADPS